LDRILTPSSTTAAAVSSQEVSIPRIFIHQDYSIDGREQSEHTHLLSATTPINAEQGSQSELGSGGTKKNLKGRSGFE